MASPWHLSAQSGIKAPGLEGLTRNDLLDISLTELNENRNRRIEWRMRQKSFNDAAANAAVVIDLQKRISALNEHATDYDVQRSALEMQIQVLSSLPEINEQDFEYRLDYSDWATWELTVREVDDTDTPLSTRSVIADGSGNVFEVLPDHRKIVVRQDPVAVLGEYLRGWPIALATGELMKMRGAKLTEIPPAGLDLTGVLDELQLPVSIRYSVPALEPQSVKVMSGDGGSIVAELERTGESEWEYTVPPRGKSQDGFSQVQTWTLQRNAVRRDGVQIEPFRIPSDYLLLLKDPATGETVEVQSNEVAGKLLHLSEEE